MSQVAIDPKGLFKEFTSAPWKERPQMEDFVQRAVGSRAFPLKKAFESMIAQDSLRNQLEFKNKLYCYEKIASTFKQRGVAEFLLDAVSEAPLSVQSAIYRILKEINDPAWHNKALKLLYSKEMNARRAGKEICSSVGGKTMLENLGQALKNRSMPPRSEALETLANIAGHHSLPIYREVFPRAGRGERLNIISIVGNERFMKAVRRDAGNFLVECCQDKEASVVKAAIRMLGRIGTQEQLPVLMEMGSMPGAPHLEEIIQAVGALAGEDNREVIELFEMALRTKKMNLQMAAISGLYQIGTSDVLSALSISLRDENIQVRQKGADVFVKLANEGKIEISRLLIFLLKERDTNVRRIAIEIIDSVGKKMPDLWKNLISHLRDADWWVRERVTDVLVKIGGDKITGHIVALLDDPKEILRRYAIEVLVRIKNTASLPRLMQAAFKDTDWWVRERAVEAIGLLQNPEIVPQLVELVKYPEMRWVTVKALGQLKDARAVPHLLPLLAEGEPEFRLDLLHTLNIIGDPSMLEPIRKLIYDTNCDVRQKALSILRSHKVQVDSDQDYYKNAQNLTMLDKLLLQTKKRGGTDLFLHAGSRPYIRYLADIIPIADQVLSSDQVWNLVKVVMSTDKQKEVMERGDADFSYQIEGEKSRFRANIYRQRNGVSAVFRVINDTIIPIENLGFSKHVINLMTYHQGMILVTGPAGSGKTTTLMAMLDYVNRLRKGHIITLEDPVEYYIQNQSCLVNQREVGRTTASFYSGLRAALREDPDVILIGEMRDIETFSIAITAAETGHLVLGTLHTLGAAQTIDRLVDAFPHEQQGQIRSMVSESLKGVISQQLIRKKEGDERMLVTEVMIMNDAISNMVRKAKSYQIPSVLATSSELGMHEMDNQLKILVEKDLVAYEDALVKAVNKKEFEAYFKPPEEKAEKAEKADQPAEDKAVAKPAPREQRSIN